MSDLHAVVVATCSAEGEFETNLRAALTEIARICRWPALLMPEVYGILLDRGQVLNYVAALDREEVWQQRRSRFPMRSVVFSIGEVWTERETIEYVLGAFCHPKLTIEEIADDRRGGLPTSADIALPAAVAAMEAIKFQNPDEQQWSDVEYGLVFTYVVLVLREALLRAKREVFGKVHVFIGWTGGEYCEVSLPGLT